MHFDFSTVWVLFLNHMCKHFNYTCIYNTVYQLLHLQCQFSVNVELSAATGVRADSYSSSVSMEETHCFLLVFFIFPAFELLIYVEITKVSP